MTDTTPTTTTMIGEAASSGWMPTINMLFDSENNAYDFYNTYAENVGFFVRRSTLWTTSKNIVTRRTFVCSREGFREKKKGAKEVKSPRPETRIGCEACMTIRLTPNGKYRVTEFEANHNHPLATAASIQMLKAKKLRRKARATRVNLVDDSVKTPEFETEDEAYEFYNMYAGRMGFTVRRASMTVTADDVITRRMFVCSKEGFRERKKGAKRVKKPRPETRTGCPACMIIRITPGGKYHVSEFVTCHNHPLSAPSSSDLLVSQNSETGVLDDESGMADVLMMTPLSADNPFNMQARTAQDISIHSVDSKHIKSVLVGDAGATLEYLQKMQEENPSFFYAVQADDDDNLINFFWADAKSVLDFNYFGDVVCFDSTYKYFGYGRPFAQFIGVNHHKQAIIFGSALLHDESKKSYKWLFETFKNTMHGKQSKTILTDRSELMTEAIAEIMPGTFHRYCVWHIYQNTLEQLTQAFHGSKTLASDFSRCLFDYEDEDEFLMAWRTMLENYDLKDNQWLANLFEEREKWALVYKREAFYADMKSVQLKDNLSCELKKFLSPEIELFHFYENYNRLLDERRFAELQADVHASQNSRKLPSMRVLRQAAELYTHAAFKMFEKEFEFYMDCMLYSCGQIGTISEYKVTMDEKPKDHFVKFDSLDGSVTCSCKKFEFIGIPCHHMLKVLDSRNIKDLPQEYVLKRWRKDAKVGAFGGSCDFLYGGNPQTLTAKRYNYLCRIFSIVASRASKSFDASAFIESQSDVLMEQVEQILRVRTIEMSSLINASCDRAQNSVESIVIGGFRHDRVSQGSFVGATANGFLGSRLSHPTMCWGQFPAGPPEQ
ncbi:protein FAR1-RELATED SEQUENCE 5-like [Phalaenopsis equestris]|uniref:protein FAR1-RELATED SEQUENCE 5-like n=1 Tax=Phalaenopsis equestris TaxID=78828 RepID=UPI0009E5E752|nr:protein FAR1-RELATED SEQUENCE 5-like [Phalaenopsis equestris]XP_020595405.1 protein FAR1-RELATED SEQUENCE 5-like [Phalaenopsis equestris]XP_020595406.1 protein FAR1-RELATED SEQUENCE 5-like [Phalaenopsis equestris]